MPNALPKSPTPGRTMGEPLPPHMDAVYPPLVLPRFRVLDPAGGGSVGGRPGGGGGGGGLPLAPPAELPEPEEVWVRLVELVLLSMQALTLLLLTG